MDREDGQAKDSRLGNSHPYIISHIIKVDDIDLRKVHSLHI